MQETIKMPKVNKKVAGIGEDGDIARREAQKKWCQGNPSNLR